MIKKNIAVIFPKTQYKQSAYTILEGINHAHVEQLISYACTDPYFKNNTSDLRRPNGNPGRFASHLEYENWLQAGKSIYTLVDSAGNLVGIIWFSKEYPKYDLYMISQLGDRSKYGFTFAIRLYGSARGIGLARPFAESAYKHFSNTDVYLNESSQGIWLETREENLPAIKLYKHLGYKLVGQNESAKTILMVLD